jgi:hypothetical protein
MPENLSPTFRVAVGTDPNTQVIGPAVHGRAADYHHIKVFWGAVHNGTASDKAGSPVYDKVLQVRYIYPGSGDYLDVAVKRWPADGGEPVITDPDRYNRYREVLEKYEAKADQKAQGTPLGGAEPRPARDRHAQRQAGRDHRAARRRARQLPRQPRAWAGAPCATGRGRSWRATAGNAPLARMQAENDGLRADVDAMRNKVGLATWRRTQADAKRDAETRGEARRRSRPKQASPIRSARPREGRAQPQQHTPAATKGVMTWPGSTG